MPAIHVECMPPSRDRLVMPVTVTRHPPWTAPVPSEPQSALRQPSHRERCGARSHRTARSCVPRAKRPPRRAGNQRGRAGRAEKKTPAFEEVVGGKSRGQMKKRLYYGPDCHGSQAKTPGKLMARDTPRPRCGTPRTKPSRHNTVGQRML